MILWLRFLISSNMAMMHDIFKASIKQWTDPSDSQIQLHATVFWLSRQTFCPVVKLDEKLILKQW